MSELIRLLKRKESLTYCPACIYDEWESTQIPLHSKAQPRDEYTQSRLRRNLGGGAPNNVFLYLQIPKAAEFKGAAPFN